MAVCKSVPPNFTGKRITKTTYSDGTVKTEVENYENGIETVIYKFSKLNFTHMLSNFRAAV